MHKKNEILSFVKIQMDLEGIGNKSEKDKWIWSFLHVETKK